MSQRLLIFIPELNPATFVFFYFKGASGRSYSIRDYSGPGPAIVRYAEDFSYTAEEILALARRPGCHIMAAERVPTDDLHYWHRITAELNRKYLSPNPANGLPGTAIDFTQPVATRKVEAAAAVTRRKPMRTGKGEKGSRYCLHQWVNERGEDLADHLVSASPSLSAFAPVVEWVSPLAAGDYYEYRDDFLRPFGLERHEPALREFWPAGGPQWDGLAHLRGPTSSGVLLVEAKAHPRETTSTCQASEPSRTQISSALHRVRTFMGSGEADWLSGSYQLANRLGFLYFLTEVARVPAWLALVHFVNDTSYHPTTLREWRRHQQALWRSLGLHSDCPLLNRVIPVFIDAPTRESERPQPSAEHPNI